MTPDYLKLVCLLTNIGLAREYLQVTNALAYFTLPRGTKKKVL
jgi:hypothetical protein